MEENSHVRLPQTVLSSENASVKMHCLVNFAANDGLNRRHELKREAVLQEHAHKGRTKSESLSQGYQLTLNS
jgi:hypothetical protein